MATRSTAGRARLLVMLLSGLGAGLLSLAGGEGDRASAGGAETRDFMVEFNRSNAEVVRSVLPLLTCENLRCYRAVGSKAVPLIARHQRNVATLELHTSDACLKGAIRRYEEVLGAYAFAAYTAASGRSRASDRMMSHSTRLEVAFNRAYARCNSAHNPAGTLALALVDVSADVSTIVARFDDCETRSCARTVAQRLNKRVGDARRLWREFARSLSGDGVPACTGRALAAQDRLFAIYEASTAALARGDSARSERLSEQVIERAPAVQQQWASCWASPG